MSRIIELKEACLEEEADDDDDDEQEEEDEKFGCISTSATANRSFNVNMGSASKNKRSSIIQSSFRSMADINFSQSSEINEIYSNHTYSSSKSEATKSVDDSAINSSRSQEEQSFVADDTFVLSQSTASSRSQESVGVIERLNQIEKDDEEIEEEKNNKLLILDTISSSDEDDDDDVNSIPKDFAEFTNFRKQKNISGTSSEIITSSIMPPVGKTNLETYQIMQIKENNGLSSKHTTTFESIDYLGDDSNNDSSGSSHETTNKDESSSDESSDTKRWNDVLNNDEEKDPKFVKLLRKERTKRILQDIATQTKSESSQEEVNKEDEDDDPPTPIIEDNTSSNLQSPQQEYTTSTWSGFDDYNYGNNSVCSDNSLSWDGNDENDFENTVRQRSLLDANIDESPRRTKHLNNKEKRHTKSRRNKSKDEYDNESSTSDDDDYDDDDTFIDDTSLFQYGTINAMENFLEDLADNKGIQRIGGIFLRLGTCSHTNLRENSIVMEETTSSSRFNKYRYDNNDDDETDTLHSTDILPSDIGGPKYHKRRGRSMSPRSPRPSQQSLINIESMNSQISNPPPPPPPPPPPILTTSLKSNSLHNMKQLEIIANDDDTRKLKQLNLKTHNQKGGERQQQQQKYSSSSKSSYNNKNENIYGMQQQRGTTLYPRNQRQKKHYKDYDDDDDNDEYDDDGGGYDVERIVTPQSILPDASNRSIFQTFFSCGGR